LAGVAMDKRSAVVIRGARKPFEVEFNSRIEEASGLGVPIPTLFWEFANSRERQPNNSKIFLM